MTTSIRHCTRAALLAVSATFALLTLVACGGGSGGGGPTGPMSVGDTTGDTMADGTGDAMGDGTPSGSRATYTVSADGGAFGSTPVTISPDAITVANRTVRFDSASQVGTLAGHYRAFDAAGATSGPATEVHYFGQRDGYSYIQFGSWARGIVSPNPGFRIGERFGAFLVPNTSSEPTPTSNLPTTGTATWEGHYAGYVDKEGVGVSQVVGEASMTAHFGSTVFGGTGTIAVQLYGPDNDRSSFAAPPKVIPGIGVLYPSGSVQMIGQIRGNTFESVIGGAADNAALNVIDTICVDVNNCLYSPGRASSGGMEGGFFGSRGGEVGGTYQFTLGRTKAAGSFGGTLQ